MITTDLYEAAYAKVKGAKLGKVNFPIIELLGDDKKIQKDIEDYYQHGEVDAKEFVKEIHFIKYLAEQSKRNLY